MAVKLTNNATSTLVGNLLVGATTLTIQPGHSPLFPSPTGADWFPVTVVDTANNMEIMRCTARAGNVLTVVRAQEGTAAQEFASGSGVDVRLTAGAVEQILVDAAHSAAPAGKIGEFAMTTPPQGWLKANGALVSRATYAELFAAIGTVWGAGDGATTFKLPDYRGSFRRGWDDGRGLDSGRAFGVQQAEALKSHVHTGTGSAASDGAHTHTGSAASDGAHAHTASSAGAGGHSHSGATDTQGAHAHNGWTDSQGSHTHNVTAHNGGGAAISGGGGTVPNGTPPSLTTSSAGAHSHNVGIDTQGNHAHNLSINGVGDHAHAITVNSAGAHTHAVTVASGGAHTHAVTVDVAATGGAETRPVNDTALVCIKY